MYRKINAQKKNNNQCNYKELEKRIKNNAKVLCSNNETWKFFETDNRIILILTLFDGTL